MQQNKITTKQTLQKLQENLADKDFRKEFGRLFVDYLDVNNRDNNAFYHKILKLLQDRGFSKQEAEDFFKDLRVKENKTILQLSKIQKEIHKAQEEYKKNRIKILINPFSLTTMLNLYLNLYTELSNKIAKLKEEMLLKLKINVHLDKKIKEIEEILNKNLKKLQEMQEDQQDNKVTKLNNVFKDTETLQNKLQDLQESLIEQELTQELTISGKEKEEKEQKEEIQTQTQHQDQQNNQEQQPSSPEKVHQQQTTLETELEDCLKAVADGVNTADPKILAFLTISEFLHRGNIENKELYEHFKDVLDKREFDSIVNVNKFLINGALEYNAVKEVLDKGDFNKLMELGGNVSIKQQQIDNKLDKDKEIGIGQPSKINLNMPGIS